MSKEKKLNDMFAMCPFFVRHDGSCISCEGILAGSIDKISFERGRKKLYYDQYCCDSFQSCPRYLHLMTKYKEE